MQGVHAFYIIQNVFQGSQTAFGTPHGSTELPTTPFVTSTRHADNAEHRRWGLGEGSSSTWSTTETRVWTPYTPPSSPSNTARPSLWGKEPYANDDLLESPPIDYAKSPYACIPLPDVGDDYFEHRYPHHPLSTPPPTPPPSTMTMDGRAVGRDSEMMMMYEHVMTAINGVNRNVNSSLSSQWVSPTVILLEGIAEESGYFERDRGDKELKR